MFAQTNQTCIRVSSLRAGAKTQGPFSPQAVCTSILSLPAPLPRGLEKQNTQFHLIISGRSTKSWTLEGELLETERARGATWTRTIWDPGLGLWLPC